MKKRIFAAILVAVLLVSAVAVLAACQPKRQIPGFVDGKTNIVFYTWAGESEIALIQEVIDAFQEENEDINVVVQKADNDYYSDLELMIANRQGPDIVQMKPGDIDNFLRSGALESLQPYIDQSVKDGKMSYDMIWSYNDAYRYNPETKIRGNSEDEIYSLIKDFSCDFVLNYNKKLVDSSVKELIPTDKRDSEGYLSQTTPLTWSEYRTFARAIQNKNTSIGGASLDNEPLQQLLEWIQQGGGSLWSADHKTIVDIVNTPAVYNAFEHYRLMRDECTGNDQYIDGTSTTTRGPAQLKVRTAATTFYGLWAYGTYNMDEDASKCITGFAPTPVPDNYELKSDSKYAGITAQVGLSISADSVYKDAAWKFIEFYFTEGQKMLLLNGSNIPGNKLVAQDEFLNSTSLTANQKAANKFFYDLAMQHGFVIDFNKYLSQPSIEKQLGVCLSEYFKDSKGKAFNRTNWDNTLNKLRAALQNELDRATSNL